MVRIFSAIFLMFLVCETYAQNRPNGPARPQGTNSGTPSMQEMEGAKAKQKVANIKEYLIISNENDTTYVDTTLTIQKEYKFNYLRRDNFELIPFSNLGQTYNTLAYDFGSEDLMPSFGARARHFNYMEVADINYYRVPTPLTELLYKSAFEQGQLADSFFTVNTSPQLNLSIAYKGLRSLGKYQHILTSTGNFRVTANYQTKNKRYFMKTHVVTQDLMNQENGGLRDDNIEYFETGDPEFLDRSILEVNFENAESMLKGKRFYLDHKYYLLNKKDTLSTNQISLGHIMSMEDKSYQYDQSNAVQEYFGTAFKASGFRDRVTLENFYNQVNLNYSNDILGDLQFNVSNTNYNYGYDKVVVLNGNTITNRIKGEVFAVGGKYHKQFKGFELKGSLGLNVVGDFEGNFIKGEATYKLNDDISVTAMVSHNSKAPNYNVLLYQSNYINYNWQNNFNNTETQQLEFQLKSEKLANISVDYSTITDYTYFKKDSTSAVKAYQANNTINYLKVKLEKEIRVGHFALNNTVLYQKATNGSGILNVPEIITRNTLYYSNHVFKKAMYLQTGVTLNYFTKYYMNAYDPLLAEFYVQNDRQYGEFPRLDFFINAKIRQTRIFLKAEHFNSAFTGYDYYSAPNYPYRDFTVRFGIVWNFFM
ncbi:putative porin [Flavobacteriaceae bacterium XHP0103]|uniref:putative porin n=1 Tax=Marixanthotalea marina TaxID=2844359 RepID=UPI002989B0EC|nr:putative porin [Marixanthotalea marina]MBU3822660.1 putative porin [Marixanthotalea marina]